MKRCFVERNFSAKSLDIIETANAIIDGYLKQGLRLTLRQLYYQFVSHHGLANEQKSYKRLAEIVSDARLAGLIDWDAIEDRGREPMVPADWDAPQDLIRQYTASFRRDRWIGQDVYVELWVEKQALAGVLWPIASRWHVPLVVNKGYSSSSAMYDSARRILRRTDVQDVYDRPCIVIYIGDHDPSGEDMVRDVYDRLNLLRGDRGREIEVRKLALTMEQIEQYKPPPNPAKVTDSRAAAYRKRHGDSSWEVDSLDPATFRRLIDSEMRRLIDMERMDRVIAQEKVDKRSLEDAAQWLEDREED